MTLNICLDGYQEECEFVLSPIQDDVSELSIHCDSNTDISKFDSSYFVDKLKSIDREFLLPIELDVIDRLISKNKISIDKYVLHGEYEQINKFVSRNPQVLDTKTVIGNMYGLSNKEVDEIRANLLNYDRFYFRTGHDYVDFTFEQFKEATREFENIIGEVKKYNYSDFECALHLYDLVRDRYYINDDSKNGTLLSRGTASVLIQDKIVCKGFASLYSDCLKALGIRAKPYDLESKTDGNGHSITVAYIKDDKYDIDGVLFFDPTWDCRKSDDNNFLNIYKYFAKDMLQMSKIYHNYDSRLSDDTELIDKYYEYIETDDPVEKRKLESSLMKKMMYLSLLIDGVALPRFAIDNNIDLDVIERYSEMLSSNVGNTKFMKALINVRKNEYYSNPSKYLFDVDSFYTALVYSNFNLDYTKEDRFLSDVLGEDYRNKKACTNNMHNIMQETNLERDIEGVKLAKVLRLALNKKKNN